MIHWRISGENLSLLDSIQDIEAGTLDIEGYNLDPESFKRVIRFVAEQGILLHTLVIHPKWSSVKGDFEHLDFATCCPHLQTLDLKQVTINESVFTHPSLEILKLLEADLKRPQDISIGNLNERDGYQLKEVSMMDCHIPAQTLTIGPASQLKVFQYYLDEDFAEPDAAPHRFVFQACPQLETITIHACASWTILISGLSPQLKHISLDATEYCTYQWKIEGVDDQQRARYHQMLEEEE
jgi:hypothetical protein